MEYLGDIVNPRKVMNLKYIQNFRKLKVNKILTNRKLTMNGILRKMKISNSTGPDCILSKVRNGWVKFGW